MRKEKHTEFQSENQTPIMKVIDVSANQSHLEYEIDRQVKSLRSLIKQLHPKDRQMYFNGLLSHILSQPVDTLETNAHVNDSYDYCNLSVEEVSLIKELSIKIHELYRVTEDGMRA